MGNTVTKIDLAVENIKNKDNDISKETIETIHEYKLRIKFFKDIELKHLQGICKDLEVEYSYFIFYSLLEKIQSHLSGKLYFDDKIIYVSDNVSIEETENIIIHEVTHYLNYIQLRIKEKTPIEEIFQDEVTAILSEMLYNNEKLYITRKRKKEVENNILEHYGSKKKLFKMCYDSDSDSDSNQEV